MDPESHTPPDRGLSGSTKCVGDRPTVEVDICALTPHATESLKNSDHNNHLRVQPRHPADHTDALAENVRQHILPQHIKARAN